MHEGAKLDAYAVCEAIRHAGGAADAVNAILESLEREGLTTAGEL